MFGRLSSRLLSAALCLAAALIVGASTHGGGGAISRILIVAGGQSNMDQFRQGGLAVLRSSLTATTGLPTIAVDTPCISSGSDLSFFLPAGGGTFTGCVAAINAVIQPTDQVVFIWDQGEGNANDHPPDFPTYYAPTLAGLHSSLAAAIGRTTANAPWISTSKGTASNLAGSNTTPLTWTVITNALKSTVDYDHNMYWFNQYDLPRGDGYHYSSTAAEVPRFARYITTLMGYTTGQPVFELASAAVVSATVTTVNVKHNLGTDWSPTTGASGTNGLQVSGDNGVTWVNASHSHGSATEITLTHASISTTNARLVRNLYGFAPPDTDAACTGPVCLPPTNMIFDNSTSPIPLSPTTLAPLRAAGLTTLPMPTWRDISEPAGSGQTQTLATNMLLGPASENFRKFLILSFTGPALAGGGATPITGLTITPQDFLGNNVGTTITLTSPTMDAAAGNTGILGLALNANNAGATTFGLSVTYSGPPFANTVIQAWTVPFADLTSTTHTGAGSSTTASSFTGTTTLNTSSGGFVITSAFSNVTQNLGSTFTFTGSESYATEWTIESGIPTMSGDASNTGANAASSLTATFNVSGTVNLAAASWH